MKKFSLILIIAMLLVGGAVGALSTSAQAQFAPGYSYPPPPPNPYVNPWVGTNTPWVYYNGDWFLNGILYYFFGPRHGWAPYYAYPPTYIVRPPAWYAPKWQVWYRGHPRYYQTFVQRYPYWQGHKVGHRYNEHFYNQHHRGQGEGWHKGFHSGPPPERRGPEPGHGRRHD